MNAKREDFEFRTAVVGYPLLFVLWIWIIFWIEVRFGFDFNDLGIYPRTVSGLIGILCSPFIHADLAHLWHNTLPLLILTMALFYFYPKVSWKVLGIGVLITGVSTWMFGRVSHHIGASGVIYMLFGFLLCKGILTKHFRLIAVSLWVVFVYGSMVWYVLPVDPKISWEGHASGLWVGIALAFGIKKGIVMPESYQWQSPEYDPDEDEFLKHFDADGNFIAILPEDKKEEEEHIPEIEIKYEYRPKPHKDQEGDPSISNDNSI